jgi:hypothetical protein
MGCSDCFVDGGGIDGYAVPARSVGFNIEDGIEIVD